MPLMGMKSARAVHHLSPRRRIPVKLIYKNGTKGLLAMLGPRGFYLDTGQHDALLVASGHVHSRSPQE